MPPPPNEAAAAAAPAPPADGPGAPCRAANLALLAAAAAAQMATLGLSWLIARSRAGKEALPARDERDRAIERRSSAAAYSVLIAGMILVGCVLPFSASGWELSASSSLRLSIAHEDRETGADRLELSVGTGLRF